MNATSPISATTLGGRVISPSDGEVPGSSASAVSWGAILAGAAAAAALSMILLILGTGLGLSSVSPWVGAGASATTLGIWTIICVTLTQLAASGMGGFHARRAVVAGFNRHLTKPVGLADLRRTVGELLRKPPG